MSLSANSVTLPALSSCRQLLLGVSGRHAGG